MAKRNDVFGDVVHVENLREVQSAMRQMERTLPAELRKTNKGAAEFIAVRARARAESLGGVQAHVAPSIAARGEQRYAKITFGGARYPMAGGANFGSYHDIVRSTSRGNVLGWNQFPRWGGNQFTGGAADQFIYHSIREYHDEFVEVYTDALKALTDRVFGKGALERAA